MRILVVNDDGIKAEGIAHLAELAKTFGEVTVVAPAHQCSAMSHRITYEQDMILRKVKFPVKGVEAYSLTGTPADCVRVGITEVMKDAKPDIVFSGINKGYNIGFEIMYSGTVGGAMEALVFGVPGIAFSQFDFDDFSAMDAYFKEVVEEVMSREIGDNQVWNINVPNCTAEEVQGIDYDCRPARIRFYHDHFEMEDLGRKRTRVREIYTRKDDAPEGSDIAALLKHKISVEKLTAIV